MTIQDVNVKEIANTNIYVKHANEIRNISKENNVDVGVAADMFAVGYSLPVGNPAYREFTYLCRKLTLDAIVEALA